jgi:hypothetical protein
MLEYLLSSGCPLTPEDIDYALSPHSSYRTCSANEWWAVCTVAMKYKRVGRASQPAVLQEALLRRDWGFLKMAEDNEYPVMDAARHYFALTLNNQPGGPSIEALTEFSAHEAFSTLVRSMFTPMAALSRTLDLHEGDGTLWIFACALHGQS